MPPISGYVEHGGGGIFVIQGPSDLSMLVLKLNNVSKVAPKQNSK